MERVPELQFQRPAAEVEIAFDDARRLEIADGDEVDVRSNGTSVRLRARVTRSLARGTVRAADEHAHELGHVGRGGEGVMQEPWWISLIKAVVLINILLGAVAYTTWLERKLLGRMQNRYGPNRAGIFGLLQPIADLVKMIRKEIVLPGRVDAPAVHRGAGDRGGDGARGVRRDPVRARVDA